MKIFYTYILANRKRGTLYIGVTSNLLKRMWEHKNSINEGFTKKYKIHMLVYYETHSTFENAVIREKKLKNWRREWKIDLVEKTNPSWEDFYDNISEDFV